MTHCDEMRCATCQQDPCYCNTIVEGPLVGVNIDHVASAVHGGLTALLQVCPTDFFEPCEGVKVHTRKLAAEVARMAVENVERQLASGHSGTNPDAPSVRLGAESVAE